MKWTASHNVRDHKLGGLVPVREKLPHEVPHWVDSGREIYFITVNCRIRGKNQLCSPETSDALIKSAIHQHRNRKWFLHHFLLMPDHLHALLSFPLSQNQIQRTMSSWKSWTAKQCGIQWQRDFFEHRLRGTEAIAEKSLYIRNNPVRAGLADSVELWPWLLWSSPFGDEIFQGWESSSHPR